MAQDSYVIQGLHHITLVTSNEEVNRRFYTEILGLRRVKLSVNQDDIFHRHLFYADEKGTTGSAITFFEWPELPRGTVGLGSPHHLSYSVGAPDALPRWISWLKGRGVSVAGPIARDGRISIYLMDPDGVLIELAAKNSEGITVAYLEEMMKKKGDDLPTVTQIDRGMRLGTFNHASPLTTDPDVTIRFFEKLVGLKNSFTTPNPDQEGSDTVAIGNNDRPDFLRYLTGPDIRDGLVGTGSVHHIAMAVEDDSDQLMVLHRLNDAGIRNSGIIDRFWFHSLYFRDPDGNLLEVATKNPGYADDEPEDKLGSHLALPNWLEPKRGEIESVLEKTDLGNRGTWPPKSYPIVRSPPESLSAA